IGPVYDILARPGGALIGGWNGLFVARRFNGAINVVQVDAGKTGAVIHIRELSTHDALIQTQAGTFVVHASNADGIISVTHVAPAGTEEVFQIREHSNHTALISAEKGLFAARISNDGATIAR